MKSKCISCNKNIQGNAKKQYCKACLLKRKIERSLKYNKRSTCYRCNKKCFGYLCKGCDKIPKGTKLSQLKKKV